MGSILVEKVQKQTRQMEKLICDVVSMKALAKPISETQEIKIMFIIIILLESSKDGMTFQGCSKLGQAPQAFIPL